MFGVRIERTTSRLITVFYHWANGHGGFELCTMGNVLLLKALVLMLQQTSTRSFFLKKNGHFYKKIIGEQKKSMAGDTLDFF